MSEQNKLPWHMREVGPTGEIVVFAITAAMVSVLVIGQLAYIMWKESRASPPAQAEVVDTPSSDQDSGSSLAGAEEGEAIFLEKCAACHSIGGGTVVGPDLEGVTALRDADWLFDWILMPDVMLAQGDPLATEMLEEFSNIPMPNSGLSESEVASVIAYITVASGEELLPAEASVPSSPDGDPARGEALFIGAVDFENGGPACISCHGLSDVGLLGGGTLGPDLTNVAGRYGDAGLTAALQGLPFPSMKAIFDDHPLSEEEVAHLYALFVATDTQTPTPMDYKFVLVGLGGLVVLFLLSQLIWSKRLRGIRIPLVGRS